MNADSSTQLVQTDYYSLLGVSKSATPDEIRAAYKKHAATYHPDRHVDAQLREEAKEKFYQIRNAYEVLIDERKRAIYDLYGVEGVRAGWELSNKLQSPEEIRKVFEKMQRINVKTMMQQELNMRGKIVTSLSLADMYDILTDTYHLPPILGMDITQRVKALSSKTWELNLSGRVTQYNGNGTGNLGCEIRKHFDDDTLATVEVQANDRSDISLFEASIWYRLSNFATARCVLFYDITRGIGVTPTLFHQFLPNTIAHCSLTFGGTPNLQLGVTHNLSDQSRLSAEISMADKSAEVSFARTLSKNSSIKIGTKLSADDPAVMIGGERHIGKFSSIGMTVLLKMDSITVQISLQRGGYKFVLPILVSRQPTLASISASLVIPAAVTALVTLLIIEPRRRMKKQRKVEQLKKEHAETVTKAKKSAESAIKLMINTVTRKRQIEEQRSGLIIVEALYGNLSSESKQEMPSNVAGDSEPSVIDVTIPVQYLVEDSQLHLHNTSKASILGFYDPCIGQEKQLYIKYLFQDKLHEVTMLDLDAVALPLASHKIN